MCININIYIYIYTSIDIDRYIYHTGNDWEKSIEKRHPSILIILKQMSMSMQHVWTPCCQIMDFAVCKVRLAEPMLAIQHFK